MASRKQRKGGSQGKGRSKGRRKKVPKEVRDEILAAIASGRTAVEVAKEYGVAKARLWNTMTGRPVGPAFSHAGAVRDVVFSPDGSRFIAGVSQGTAAIWTVPSTAFDGSKEQIIDRMSVITGMRLDSSGALEILDAPEWDTYNQRHIKNSSQ